MAKKEFTKQELDDIFPLSIASDKEGFEVFASHTDTRLKLSWDYLDSLKVMINSLDRDEIEFFEKNPSSIVELLPESDMLDE